MANRDIGSYCQSFFLVGGMMLAEAASNEDYELKIPLGLDEDAFKVPEDNPLTRDKVELGRLLFFDKRLSANNTIACASCHIPALAFTDGQPVSSGIHHLQGGRSAPTAINRAFSIVQFWDGEGLDVGRYNVTKDVKEFGVKYRARRYNIVG